MKLNLKEELRQAAEENFSNKDRGGVRGKNYLDLSKADASKMRLRQGKQAIDIIPFSYKGGILPSKKAGKFDNMLDIHIHKGFNQTKDRCICLERTLGKPCPVCEQRRVLENDDPKTYEKEIKSMYAQRRVLMNVINLKDDEDDEHNGEIQILDESYALFAKELLEEAYADKTSDPIDFYTPDEGKSVLFRAQETVIGTGKYLKFKNFTFDDRDEEYPDSIVDKAFKLDELLIIPTYEEVAEMLGNGGSAEEDEEEPDEKPNKKSYKEPEKAKSKRSKYAEEEDEEEEEEDEPEQSIGCPYGKNFGSDGDTTDDLCRKCSKEHTTVFRECIIDSMK